MKKSKHNQKVQPHPRIQELDSLEDFKNHIGIADIPSVPLVEQIEELQKEAARRRNQQIIDSNINGNFNATTAHTYSSRYRKKKTTTAHPKEKVALKGSDGEEEFSSGSENNFIYKDNTPTDLEKKGLEEQEEGVILFAILDYTQFLIPLMSAHIIFDVLVRIQYAQDVSWENVTAQVEILQRAALAAPILLTLHLYFHQMRETRIFRIGSFIAAVSIGAYLLYISNEEAYYFMMKRAPPLGTIWVWLFIEMHWAYSAASLIVVAFWMKLRGYSI